MEIDENLLGQVSDFLKTSEGAEIMAGLKSTLGLGGDEKKSKGASVSSLLSSLSGAAPSPPEPESPFANIDMSKLIGLVTAISSAKTDDRATNLLLALKPLLNPTRRPKIDHAISIMRIMALIPILEEHGFSIGDLFSK
ncbi:MAG: hypothetical protein UHH95_02500 [Oscillospiraceae bacterium]|nr:hypothetical protein [Oscillospiraceae bacterium]